MASPKVYFEGEFKTTNGIVTHPSGIPFDETPNQSAGITPKYLILHYTAGSSFESSIAWMKNKVAQASAHFIVDFDGRIVQLVKTNRRAWHTGRTNYRGMTGMNSVALGIEMTNPGHLERMSDGRWRSHYGQMFRDGDTLRTSTGFEFEAVIREGVHPTMGGGVKGWLQATPEQIESTILLGRYLMQHHNLQECLGHDQISVGRKWDTGLTIDPGVFAKIEGRGDVEATPGSPKGEVPTGRVSTNGSNLNLRYGPSTSEAVIGKLSNGERVEILSESSSGPWFKVRSFRGSVTGFAHSGFIIKD